MNLGNVPLVENIEVKEELCDFVHKAGIMLPEGERFVPVRDVSMSEGQ
jgi:hypothetical protein